VYFLKISVIVCTHNRCELLRESFRSLLAQDYCAQDYELIVVDNNSTDGTRDVFEEFAIKRNGLHVRYVMEEKIGLSHARNRGIAEAQGDIMAFIDDDARAEKSWLSQLVKVYSEEKDAGCVGGRVILDWYAEKPFWWQPELDEVFNGINYSDKRIVLSHPRYPYGTNISYKADILEKVGLFGTDLGRIGSKLLAGEETELCLRIEKAGYKIFYEPSAVVYHRVEPDKLTKSYIRKRAIWHGRSQALIELKHFGREYVRKKSLGCFKSLLWWIRSGRFPLAEQKRYLFVFGYFVQGLLLKAKLG